MKNKKTNDDEEDTHYETRGGDRWELYQARRKEAGKLKLEDPQHELILQMVVKGSSKTAICRELKIDEVDYDGITNTLEFIKRLEWRMHLDENKSKRIETPQDAITYAQNNLVKVFKSAESDRDKIAALKMIADIGIAEKKNQCANQNNTIPSVEVEENLPESLK